MKVLVVMTALSASASALGFDFRLPREQAAIMETYKVPGDNPLYFCADPKNYTVEIQNVDISPNPPKAGQKLSISAEGVVKKKIVDGTKIHLQVKYGLITLINQEADLCEQSDKVNLKCPVENGTLTIVKDVDLPKEIPPGTYSVTADVFPEDKNGTITCLTAKVPFSR